MFRVFSNDIMSTGKNSQAVYVHSDDLEYCFVVHDGVSSNRLAYMYDLKTHEEYVCTPSELLQDTSPNV